ncbi:hypothetical protein NQZ68_004165 [Dissostichus eleginoides]|nr:hypothetical protein NQZ68_004165 [Dissostichus eleginoides]
MTSHMGFSLSRAEVKSVQCNDFSLHSSHATLRCFNNYKPNLSNRRLNRNGEWRLLQSDLSGLSEDFKVLRGCEELQHSGSVSWFCLLNVHRLAERETCPKGGIQGRTQPGKFSKKRADPPLEGLAQMDITPSTIKTLVFPALKPPVLLPWSSLIKRSLEAGRRICWAEPQIKLTFLSLPSIQLQSQHQPDATGELTGKGSASTHIFHLLNDKRKSGWGEKKGSSSSASPSAFIVNNLLSVCNGAVLPLFPLPSFSPAQMGFTRKRGGGGVKRRKTARLPVQRSDAEVFLWLMNGTFEVSSLARCPKPASPVVGVNWPVVCTSGTVPSSLPANLVSVAPQN